MADNISKLYGELKGTYDLGSEADFRKYLSDGNNREALRKELEADYDVGDSATFSKYLGFSQPEQGRTFKDLRKSGTQAGINKAMGSAQTATTAEPQPAQPLQIPNGFGRLDSKQANQMGMGLGPVSWEEEAPKEQTKFDNAVSVTNGNGSASENKEAQKRMNQRMDELQYEQETGKRLRQPIDISFQAPTISRDEYGNIRHGENGEPLVGYTTDQAAVETHKDIMDEQAQYDQMEAEAKRNNEKLAVIGGKLARVSARESAPDMSHTAMFLGQAMAAAGSPSPTFDMRSYNNLTHERQVLESRYRVLSENQNLIDEARQEMREYNPDDNLLQKVGKGFKQAGRSALSSLANMSTWDFGGSEITKQTKLMEAAFKADNGQPLTEDEAGLLDDMAISYAINSHYGEQLSGWAKAGQTIGDSAPLMLEMYLNPATGIGRAASKGFVKYGIKTLGKEWVKNHMKGMLAGRIATRLAGDWLAGEAMALSTGIARTSADAMQRHLGEINTSVDDNGNIVYGGHEKGEDALQAFSKAITSGGIENWSEMAGEYFSPLGKFFGKMLGRAVIGKSGREALRLTGRLEGGNLNLAQRFIYDVTANRGIGAVSKGLDKFLERTQWHGVMGEYAEEVLGNIANALTVGDMTLDNAKGTGVFNKELNIDTFNSVALMGGFFSAIHTGAFAWDRWNGRMSKINKEGEKLFSNWDEVSTGIDAVSDDAIELNSHLTDLMSNKDLSKEQKQTILDYTAKLLEGKGAEMAEFKPRMESSVTQKTDDGWTVTSVDKNGKAIEQQTFNNEEEAKAFEGELKMNQQHRDMQDYMKMATGLSYAESSNLVDEFLGEEQGAWRNEDDEAQFYADIQNPKTTIGKQFREFKTQKILQKARATQAAIAQFEQDNGWEPGTILALTEADPMTLTNAELQMADQARLLLEGLAYPTNEVHVDHAQQVGSDAAQNVVERTVSTDEVIDPMNNEGKMIVDAHSAAINAMNSLFDRNEDLKEEFYRMQKLGFSPQEIVSSLSSFRPEDVQVVIDFYNSNARFLGYMNQASKSIDEEAKRRRDQRKFTGTINGNADVSNLYTVSDGENQFTLVGGNISIDPTTGQVTDSDSGLVIAIDQNGDYVSLGDASGLTVVPSGMTLDQYEEAQRIELQQQVSMVSDPNGTLMNQQEQTVSQESQAEAQPVQAEETDSSQQENAEEATTQAQAEAQQPTTAIESVIDSDGVKRYEIGIPVDDAIADMQADGLDVNAEADLAINEAQSELSKIKQPKTRAERVKNAQKQQELQNTIDYYNNVKARWAEMNPSTNEEVQPVAETRPASTTSSAQTVEEQKQQRIAEAKAKYGDLFDDDFTKANDVFELVSMWVGRKRNLAWDDVNGKRGLQKELGWTRKIGGDTKYIETLLAKNGEGIGVDEFVHGVWESPENDVMGEKRFSTEEIKEALLDLLKSAQSKSDVVDYALNNRIAQAENMMQQQQQIAEEQSAQQEEYVAEQPINEGGLPFAPADEEITNSVNENNTVAENNVSLQTENNTNNEQTSMGSPNQEGDGSGRENASASDVLRGISIAAAQAGSGSRSKERLLAQLEESARDSGYWIEDSVDEISDLKVNVGGENEVYKTEDGTYAIKLNDFAFLRDDATNFEDFLNRLESFNELFPEVALQVVGFAKNSKGKVCVVLQQPWIEAEREATEEEIDSALEEMDFYTDITGNWTDGRYEIADLKPNNVLVDKEGNLHFIDVVTFDSTKPGQMMKAKKPVEQESPKQDQQAGENTPAANQADDYLTPRDAEEEKIVEDVHNQLQQEIQAAADEVNKARTELQKAQAKESDRATDLFGNDNTFNQEGQLFDNSDMPVDQTIEGVGRRTSSQREKLQEAQNKLNKLQSPEERNSRIRGALDNKRRQTSFDEIDERHKREYEQYIKPLLDKSDEELQQLKKAKEDAVRGDVRKLVGDLEYNGIVNVLSQRYIDRRTESKGKVRVEKNKNGETEYTTKQGNQAFVVTEYNKNNLILIDRNLILTGEETREGSEELYKELEKLGEWKQGISRPGMNENNSGWIIPKDKADELDRILREHLEKLPEKGEQRYNPNPIEAMEQAANQFRQEQQEKKPKSNNKIFTDDAHEEVLKKLRAKFNNLNSGFDPEIALLMLQDAGYHIEKGARKIADCAKAMIDELGDFVRPYIKSAYNAVRDYPGMEEIAKEMSSFEEVQAFDPLNYDKQEDISVNVNKQENNDTENVVSSQQELEGNSAEYENRQEKIKALSQDIFKDLREAVYLGEIKLKTMQSVKALAKEHGLEDISLADLQELVEAETVNVAREIANMETLIPMQRFDNLVNLYNFQPSLSVRDNDRINMQQYSTPAPMAFLMGQFVKNGKDYLPEKKEGLEPSAGNGMLTIGLPKSQMRVNDIDEMRLSNLAKQGFKEVTNQDGLQSFGEKQYDVIVTNPPFGSTEPKNYDGLYEISGLEHQMAINALDSMKDDGRAAIIIGGNTEYRDNGAIKGKDRAFLNYLYSHYNVVDVINMDGKTLYSRNGTGFPTRMILINGRKQADGGFAPVQSKARAEQVKTYNELYKRVNDDILSDNNKPAGVHDTESGEGNRADAGANGGAVAETGVRNVPDRGSREQSEPLADNGQRISGSTRNAEPEGRGNSVGRGSAVVDESVPVRNGSRTEVAEPSRPTATQTNESGAGTAERRNSAERPSGEPNRPSGERQRRADDAQQDNGVQRGLGTEKVPYKKQSNNPFTLQSLMPAEQADEVKKILEKLGDVDQFLMDELGYGSIDELHQALAAEQIDSVAMAIHQMNQGNAFIIGDQTGIGKGRQAAALIRYGVKKGGFPVFVTVKKGLFSDMYRDLTDIGSPELRPFIWTADDSQHSANVTDKDGNVVYQIPSAKEQKRVVDYINENGKLPKEYDYVVTTYDTFNSGTMEYENGNKKARSFGKKTPQSRHYNGQSKRDALEKLSQNSYVIMDESHNAGGENSAISGFLQYITAKAKGTTFLSATFAKKPANMPIYSLRTAIAKAGVEVGELIEAVKRGGATFQEIMSKALTAAGQMIRRERDMTGVTIDWRGIEDEAVIQKQREQYDKIIGLFNEIIDFQRAYVDPIINNMNDAAAEVQGAVDHTPGTRDMGINNVPFASRTHIIVNQVLFSLKAEETARRAIEHLKNGKAVVIAVANTNERASEDAAAGSEEDMVMPDLSVNLIKGLEGTLRIQKQDAFGNKVQTEIPWDSLPQAAQDRYKEIQDHIESASTGLSLSPIDVIKNELKKAGYSVGELTGRKAEFVYNEDGTVKRVNRTDTDKKKVAAKFNKGELDVVLINKSAGTGISLHASSKNPVAGQKQRIMIMAQAQPDVNDEVQMRGRTDRTGQVHRSMYEYVVSQIPSEQRLLMMLKAKLRSLDANTTSSQKSKFNEMQVLDVLNKYGDQVLIQYLAENPDIYVKLADPLKWGDDVYNTPAETLVANAKKFTEEGLAARTILGRMALLKVEEQEQMLDDINELYLTEINRLNEMGENDLEITEMPLNAKTIKKDVWEQGVEPGGNNPFADNTYVEKVNMDVLVKPMKASEVKGSQERLLDGKTWDEYKQKELAKLNDWADKKEAETTETITNRAKKKAEAEQERYVKGAKKAQEKNGMTDAEIEKNGKYQYNHFYEEEMNKLKDAVDKIEKQKQVFVDAFELFNTDGVYAIPTNIYDLGSFTFNPSFGKLIDIKISSNYSTAASTISFATLDGRRKITVPISGLVKQLNGVKRELFPVINSLTAQTRNNMFGSNTANTLKVLEQNTDNWDRLTSNDVRKDGYIITGNLLKALVSTREQGLGGKLISFTTDTGEVRQGILMSDSFEPAGLTSKTPISSAKDQLQWSGDKITSADGNVTVKKDGWNGWYQLKVPKSKKKGEKYFNDEKLRDIVGSFEGSSALVASFREDKLDDVLKRLDELGVTVEGSKEDSNNTDRRYDEDIDETEAVKDRVLSEFTSSSKGEAKGRRIPVGSLTKEGRDFLENISGITMKPNVSFILNASDLRHIYNEHYGENEKDTGNNIPLTDDDIRSLVDVITKPDYVVFGVDKKDGRKVFYFLKDSGNGAYNLAEVYSDKHGNLTAKTFYKTKKGSSLRADELLNSPTLSTSETSGASLSSGANIPKLFEPTKDFGNFNTLENRRFDEGIGERQQQAKRINRISKHIDKLLDKLGTKNRTIVHKSLKDVPDDVRRHIERAHENGRRVRGWYENGEIHLFLPDVTSEYEAEKTIWHETVAHHGLRELVGEENLNKLLKALWLQHPNSEMHKWVTERMQTNGWKLNEAIEEYLAREAEKNPFKDPGLWQRLKWLVAETLHRLGFTSDPTISDIQYLFWQSQNQLTENDPMGKMKQQAFLYRLDKAAENTPYINMYATRPEDIENPNAEGAYDDGTRYSEETDEEIVERLENEPKVKVYRAMQEIDGKLYPPMAAKQGGKLVNPIELGKWEKADEHPELADENGKFKLDKGNGKSLKAAYNPYIHTSTTMLNDQFSEAQNRPNLVVVEVEVPESELTSGYKAEKAKDAVGKLEWKAGVIQGQLSGTREVILSRWDKPVRIVPTEEVAQHIYDMIKGKVDVMPTNVVTPQQREALEKLGVKFVETDNRGFIKGGEYNGSQYTAIYGKKANKKPASNTDNYTIGEYHLAKGMPGLYGDMIAWATTKDGRKVALMHKVEGGYQAEAPNFSYMSEVMPTEKEAIDNLYDGMSKEAEQETKNRRFDEDIDNPLEYSAKQVYNDRLNRVETVFSEAYQDAMVSLKTAQNAIAKDQDIPDSQNAYQAENLMHGKNKNEQDLYNKMLRDPLIDTINKILNITGMNWGDIDRYVYTKSGLERNREFYVRDWIEAERNKIIKKYEDLNPDERDIFERKAAVIETLFEDGDIETEEQKQKELAKALQESHNEYVDDIETRWHRLKLRNYLDLRDNDIDFSDYLAGLTNFIIENIDGEYNPSEHDYSGFRAMFGDEEGKYDEAEVIDDLMNQEDMMEAENVWELWDRINAATMYGLERYRQAGMRSDDQIDRIEQMFDFYVPMRGFKDDRGEDMYQYFTGKGKEKNYLGGLLKHAKGRGSEANFPISTIFAMTYKAISDCNQNLVNQKLYRLCQANPNDLIALSDSWAVAKENPTTGETIWEEVGPDITDDMDEDEVRQATIDYEEQMKELAKDGKAKKIRGNARLDYIPMDKKKQNEHVVDVRINGNKKLMVVTGNPRMAQALNGQLRFERGKNVFSKWNAAIKNMMASLFTSYSPTFALRNMFRDWTHFRTMLGVREGHGYAQAANKYYRQSLFKMVGLFKKYREGTLDESKQIEADFKDFMDNGGITGFVQMQKVDDIQKQMEKLYKQQKAGKPVKLNNALWDYTLGAIEALNEGIENNARFATFRASRHYANRTKARSAYDAKEITVNFNRKGAGGKTYGFKSQSKAVEDAAKVFGVTSQILGEGRIFFNATVQAIATTFKNFQNADESLNKPYIAKWAAKYALPPFMFGLALPMINKALAAALGGDDDDDPYANLAEWTRRKNLCFYIGNGNFITIPIGQELAAFLSLGDMFAGMTYAPELKPVDRSFDEEMVGIMNTFSPVDIDTKITKGGLMEDPISEVTGRTFSVLAPLVAVEQNLGWTGRPIYREDRFQNDPYTPEYQMVYSGTNPVLVNASKLLHELGGGDDVTRGKFEVNPAIVQYLWEQYTGGPGKVFSNTISIGKDAKDILSGNESDFNIRKVEGLKAFVQQGDDRTAYYRTQAKYRKYSEDAKKLYHDVNGYKAAAATDPMALTKLEKISKSEDFVRMQIVREADKQLSKINKAANKAEGKEKRELRQLYNQQMKQVVDLLDSVGKE